jgi:HAD superfamily hydrolase (TIGR01459 family)
MRRIAGLEAVLDAFDVFLVDQFGVLHDGRSAYPGAIAALRRIKAAGKRIGLVSNSAKRSAPNRERLHALGFAADDYDAFVTSGEVGHMMLASGALAQLFGAAPRCHIVSAGGDASIVSGTAFEAVERPERADVILIAGSEAPRVTMDHYRALLGPAAAAGVPAVCLNPDRRMLTPHGLAFAPGAIADAYADMGGAVTFVGKPHAEIYDLTLDQLGAGRGARILCCGDSVEHDVAGGAGIGAATLLTLGGIHAGVDDAALSALYATHGARPDFVAPAFRFGDAP